VMAKYWRQGNYSATITVEKKVKEFTAKLQFKDGRITGTCDGLNGMFTLKGTYNTAKPYAVKMELAEAFGIPKIDFTGNHASDYTIFGTWSQNSIPGGDCQFNYKHLSKEEEEKQEKLLRDQQMSGLIEMGFEDIHCELALQQNNYDLEKAVNWLMHGNHLTGDDGGNFHAQRQPVSKEPTDEEIQQLVNMGFSKGLAKEALHMTDGNVEQAIEWLFNQ